MWMRCPPRRTIVCIVLIGLVVLSGLHLAWRLFLLAGEDAMKHGNDDYAREQRRQGFDGQ